MYSLLIDESKDNAGHEELATCFRYVFDHKIHERFISLSRTPNADAENLVNKNILPLLTSLKITAALVAGGADGASVMSGCHEGVFEKLKEFYEWIIYVHCAAHRLNLVVTCYLSTFSGADRVISVYTALHAIFNVANNREILEAQQRELYPNQQLLEICGMTVTRWSCHFLGIDKIIKIMKAILVALQIIAGTKSKTSDKAAGTYHLMMSSSYITSLLFLHHVLAITDGLNKHLQERTIDWKAARCELDVSKQLLSSMSVSKIEEKVISLCSDISITTEYEDPIHATRKTVSDYFRLSTADGRATVSSKLEKYKDTTVKKLLKELDHRFNNMSSILIASLNSLDAHSPQYLDYVAMQPLLKNYQNVLDINNTLLEAECDRAKLMHERGSAMEPVMYPNLKKCNQLSQTIPVNTAEVERGFSCMRRVISYTRSSLTSDRASDLMLLSLNKDLLINIDINAVINRWATRRNRHIPLH
jgi:hypothetical protein